MTGKTVIAAMLTGTICGVAGAGMIAGAPVDTWSPSRYAVEFVSSSAGATGSLYFLGWQAAGEPITYTPSTDSKGLGKHLFSNKGTSAGTTVEIGAFDTNTRLHFAYTITSGVNVAPTGQLQRTDQATSMFFATEWGTDSNGYFAKVGVEDILDVKKSDMDYNDVAFRVRAIPAPGGAALMAVSLLIAGPRGRRRS